MASLIEESVGCTQPCATSHHLPGSLLFLLPLRPPASGAPPRPLPDGCVDRRVCRIPPAVRDEPQLAVITIIITATTARTRLRLGRRLSCVVAVGQFDLDVMIARDALIVAAPGVGRAFVLVLAPGSTPST